MTDGEPIAPTLPISLTHNEVLQETAEYHPGSNAITIKIPGWDKIYKISRNIADIQEEQGAFATPPQEIHVDPDTVQELQDHAKKLQTTHKQVSSYLGEHVVRLHGVSIIDSPRQYLESSILSQVVRGEEFLSTIPEKGYAVMEVYDKIDDEFEPSLEDHAMDTGNLTYDHAKAITTSERYKKDAADFAEKARKLYDQEGVMLDILKNGKIHVQMPTGDMKEVDFENLTNTDVIRLRNVAFSHDHLVLYDFYPVFKKNEVPEVARKNYESLLHSLVLQGTAL